MIDLHQIGMMLRYAERRPIRITLIHWTKSNLELNLYIHLLFELCGMTLSSTLLL
jgi:hypothetical protein